MSETVVEHESTVTHFTRVKIVENCAQKRGGKDQPMRVAYQYASRMALSMFFSPRSV